MTSDFPRSQETAAQVIAITDTAVTSIELEKKVYQEVQEINQELADNGMTRLSSEQISGLLLNLIESGLPQESRGMVKNIQTVVAPEAMMIDMIVDVEKIPWQMLPSEIQFTRPFIEMSSSKELACKMAGTPIIENGALTVDEAAIVQVGSFKLPLKPALNSGGKSGQIPLDKAPFKNIRLEDDAVVLEK